MFEEIVSHGTHTHDGCGQSFQDIMGGLFGVATPRDIDDKMGLLPRTLEIADIAPDLSKVMTPLVVGKNLIDLPGIDVVERDTFQDVFRLINEDDDCGVLHLLQNFPARSHQPSRRQRNNAIPTLFERENVLKGLRDIPPEAVGRQMASLETLD